MGLIKCPDCYSSINENVNYCPICGCAISNPKRETKIIIKETNNDTSCFGSFLQGLGCLVFIFFLLIFIFLI